MALGESLTDVTRVGDPTQAGVRESGSGVAPASPLPERIGPYRVLELIGEGGMGVVYLAEQEAPLRRQVALKLVKVGMDTRQVVARFDSERQTLALMHHPNIAAVYDAGETRDGRPYFAMEYVAGTPITEYCDERRLPTRQRLDLFRDVCHAVQHAHQKGVIHRDLKPSNVLVMEEGGRPVPKVIDFGIAKAIAHHLTESTLFTEHGLLIGTPEYASPEQTESGEDLDTRTDVYSLGVMLYELLVGGVPFDRAKLRRAGYAEIQRIIREEEPPKPSTRLSSLGAGAADVALRRQTSLPTLTREVRGDLDWIALKALEKDRARRYGSASDLAEDLRRHLQHEPVVARPPSVAYRSLKFMRKRRLLVSAAAVVLLVLGAGLATSTSLYIRAERARRDADRERATAETARATAETARATAETARATAEAAERETSRQRSISDTARRAAEATRDDALHQSYRSMLLAADGSIQTGDFNAAAEQLDSTDPALRGWEWRFLRRVFDSSPASVRIGQISRIGFDATSGEIFASSRYGAYRFAIGSGGLTRTAESLAPPGVVNANGVGLGRFAAVGRSGTLAVWLAWESPTYSCVRTAPETEGAVTCRATPGLLPPGQVLSEDERDRVVIRDLSTGRDISILRHPGVGTWTAVKPVVVPRAADAPPGVDQPTEYADTARTFGPVFSATLSADNTRLATWSLNNDIYVWDLQTATRLSVVRGHQSLVKSVVFAADARRLVSAYADGIVRVSDTETGAEAAVLHVDGPTVVAATASGFRVAVGTTDGSVLIWEPGANRAPVTLKGHSEAVTGLAFSTDSSLLATGSADRTIRVWDARSVAVRTTLVSNTRDVSSLAFNPSADRIVSASALDGDIRVWSTTGALTALGVHPKVRWVQFAGSHVLSGGVDGTVRTWDPTHAQPIRTVDLTPGRAAVSVAATANERYVAATTTDIGPPNQYLHVETRLYDLVSGRSMPLTPEYVGQSFNLPNVAFSPDGSTVVKFVGLSNPLRGVAQFYRTGSGALLGTWQTDAFLRGAVVAFSPDSRRVVFALPGQLLIGSVGSNRPDIIVSDKFQAAKAVFTPDGARLLVSDATSIQVFDAKSGTKVGEFSEIGRIVAVSPDGARLVTYARRSIRILDARRRELLLSIRLPADVTSADLSTDGERIAVAAADGTVYLLDPGPV